MPNLRFNEHNRPPQAGDVRLIHASMVFGPGVSGWVVQYYDSLFFDQSMKGQWCGWHLPDWRALGCADLHTIFATPVEARRKLAKHGCEGALFAGIFQTIAKPTAEAGVNTEAADAPREHVNGGVDMGSV